VDLGDRDEAEIVAKLASERIVVRPGTPLGGPGHIRVTYGTGEENQRFIDALAALR
jgi:histidinol-phosphate aminotransferase